MGLNGAARPVNLETRGRYHRMAWPGASTRAVGDGPAPSHYLGAILEG